MGGLLAARVLAEFFDGITVVERDVLPGGGKSRRGVPQGRHVHGMQAGGLPLMEELFPGLRAELAEDGVREVDDLGRLGFRLGGRLLSQQAQPIAPVLPVTRPHLEWRVRERVRHLPGVRVADGLEVLGLATTPGAQTGHVSPAYASPRPQPRTHRSGPSRPSSSSTRRVAGAGYRCGCTTWATSVPRRSAWSSTSATPARSSTFPPAAIPETW